MRKQVFIDTNKDGKLYAREIHRRIVPGVYYSTHKSEFEKGWALLVKLPLGYGLNIGTSVGVSVRSWEWAKYDFADIFSAKEFHRWMRWPNAKH